jgi:hypothetical protein
MFNNETLLREIVELVVVPNITMREDEEEMFEDNATEYIQRDMEVPTHRCVYWWACGVAEVLSLASIAPVAPETDPLSPCVVCNWM